MSTNEVFMIPDNYGGQSSLDRDYRDEARGRGGRMRY